RESIPHHHLRTITFSTRLRLAVQTCIVQRASAALYQGGAYLFSLQFGYPRVGMPPPSGQNSFLLIAAMNPRPCGWHQDPEKSCTCSPSVVARYQKRISGPLLDRIDIHVEVPRVNYEKLASERQGEPSRAVRERVTAARQKQAERFKGTQLLTNC